MRLSFQPEEVTTKQNVTGLFRLTTDRQHLALLPIRVGEKTDGCQAAKNIGPLLSMRMMEQPQSSTSVHFGDIFFHAAVLLLLFVYCCNCSCSDHALHQTHVANWPDDVQCHSFAFEFVRERPLLRPRVESYCGRSLA